eukprot:gene45554-60884_t
MRLLPSAAILHCNKSEFRPMLYHIYETQRSLMEPFTDFAQAASKLFSNPVSPLSQTSAAQRMAAGYD